MEGRIKIGWVGLSTHNAPCGLPASEGVGSGVTVWTIIFLDRIGSDINMSAKELGQIHTVNTEFSLIPQSGVTGFSIGDVDLPGLLTEQLQRMVRAGNMFKVVGIDMAIELNNTPSSQVISGFIRYYAPTRGRCKAFRDAFKSMADVMALQGISMRDNDLYDFKVPINQEQAGAFKNQATLDGTNGLCLNNTNAGASIFGVHNSGVRPIYNGTNVFDEGFDTILQNRSTGTDFVLNDVAPFTGSHLIASEDYEEIPFQLSISSTADEQATATFQFRPDPALYLAVLCGQLQIYIETSAGGDFPTMTNTLRVAVMVSGWKSIMGDPDKSSKKKKTRRMN